MKDLLLAGSSGITTVLDHELETYALLGYLQRVTGRFQERKLYPHLDELRSRLERLTTLRAKRDELLRANPGEVLALDLRNRALVRNAREEQDLLSMIDDLLGFAIPELQQTLRQGKDLEEELAASIHFEPVGIMPLSPREGYLLLHQGREARVYTYAMPLFRETDEASQFHSLHTRYVTHFTVGIVWSYEQIKADLVRTHRALPNPATFVFVSEVVMPHIETFMPLAKRLIYEHIEGHLH